MSTVMLSDQLEQPGLAIDVSDNSEELSTFIGSACGYYINQTVTK